MRYEKMYDRAIASWLIRIPCVVDRARAAAIERVTGAERYRKQSWINGLCLYSELYRLRISGIYIIARTV